MKRYRRYEPQQMLLLPIDPEVTFPTGSFERFLVDTIETIDSAMVDDGRDDCGGGTPYDPRAMIGIVVYAFSKGIYSSRRMAEACTRDVGFMYVSGHACPDHATICRFMQRYRDVFEQVFAQVLYVADNVGLIDYRMIAIDGTKIAGNVSKQFTGTIEEFRSRRERLHGAITRAMERQKAADTDEEGEYWRKKRARYHAQQERIEVFLRDARVKRRADGKEQRQSLSDPDSRTLKGSDGRYLTGYNAQIGVDIDSGMILAADIIDESNDKRAFGCVADRIKRSVPTHAQTYVERSTYVADNGYYSGDSLRYAAERQLDVYIADCASNRLYHPQTLSIPLSTKRIRADDCTITVASDGEAELVCPGGLHLRARNTKAHRGRQVAFFSVPRSHPTCGACAYAQRCVDVMSKKTKTFEVDAQTIQHHRFIADHHAKLHTEHGKRIYSRRMGAVERVFGEIKANRRFRSFLRRGIENVRMEWYLMAISCNVTRMWKLSTA